MQAHQIFAARYGCGTPSRYPNMRNRRIVAYRTTYVLAGDGYERDGEPEVTVYGCEPDRFEVSDGLTTAAHVAAAMLRDKYATETSNEPFHPGAWYSTEYEHPYRNEREETTFHLMGFCPAEESRIHRMWKG